MKLTAAQKLSVQQQHDAYCKSVLTNEVRKHHREEAHFAKHSNLALALLSDAELKEIAAMDEHLIEYPLFTVHGYSVPVRDARISKALAALPERKRDVILLHFYVEMADREIADTLGLKPSTVHYHKTTAIGLLRELLGGSKDDEEPTKA
jgi:DNA-directed RNA polymerase specialized sigma subunit, sigma24 homolog